jgi:hypothetical protein
MPGAAGDAAVRLADTAVLALMVFAFDESVSARTLGAIVAATVPGQVRGFRDQFLHYAAGFRK